MKKNRITLEQGDIFAILVWQSGRKVSEIAKELGLKYRNTIPTYYRMKVLPQHIKDRACDVFNVTPEVFETGQKLESMGDLLRKIENCEKKQAIHDDRFDAMDAQIQALRDNDAAQRREIDALRRENSMLRHTSNVN